MSKKSTNLPQEPFEQLKAKTGFAEFITDFALQLIPEMSDSAKMLKAMSDYVVLEHVEGWAKTSDLIGATTGFQKSPIQDKQDKENSIIVDGMASEMPDELGGLRTFRPNNNDEYLDSMINSKETSPTIFEESQGLPDPDEALARVYRIHEDLEGRKVA